MVVDMHDESMKLWVATRITIALLIRNTFFMAAVVAVSVARSYDVDWCMAALSGVGAISLVPLLAAFPKQQEPPSSHVYLVTDFE